MSSFLKDYTVKWKSALQVQGFPALHRVQMVREMTLEKRKQHTLSQAVALHPGL